MNRTGDPFETETMAELCVRQGKIGDAAAIYRRLVAAAPDDESRARRRRRLDEVDAMPREAAFPPAAPPRSRKPPPAPIAVPAAPGIVVHRAGDQVTLAWALPPGISEPALQVVVIDSGPTGPEARREVIRIDAPLGLRAFAAPGALRVLAAAGRLDGDRFVPLVHGAQTV